MNDWVQRGAFSADGLDQDLWICMPQNDGSVERRFYDRVRAYDVEAYIGSMIAANIVCGERPRDPEEPQGTRRAGLPE